MDTKYIGSMMLSGEFIKKYYDDLYTEIELEQIDDDEGYEVRYYNMMPKKTSWHPCYAINYFKIPEVNNDIKEFEFNTSSVYALELCNYEFMELDEE